MSHDVSNSGAGRRIDAEKAGCVVPAPRPEILRLRQLQRNRKWHIKSANRQINATGALLRTVLGWSPDLPEAEAARIVKRAARILAAATAGKPQAGEDAEIAAELAVEIEAALQGAEPFVFARKNIEREMRQIARQLPVAEWQRGVHGFGELGLAVIVGEAGDLSTYPSKGHLWKRLGLAPFEGRACSTWRGKGGLSSDDWIAAGYSPRRRAEMHAVIADPLFRQQSVVKGPYRAVYDRRRALTAETHADWSDGHSHMDALRVMTKTLLRDLWQEWNRREAEDRMPETVALLLPTGGSLEQEPAQ